MRTKQPARSVKLASVGLPHSPHKSRHGRTQYAQALSKTIANCKAISLNLMHASMEITDHFYSVLRDEELKNRISALSKSNNPSDQQNLVKLLENLLANIKDGS